MTDEQLEAAARKLCEIRGWRPDGLDHMTARFSNPLDTAIEYCKREILGFYQAAQAIDSVFGAGLP